MQSPRVEGGKNWMRCYKGTYGLMIGFKAALARTSREYFWAADWPDWRHSTESAEWVRSHKPAPSPLCSSRGGAQWIKTRLGAPDPFPQSAWRIRQRKSEKIRPIRRCERLTGGGHPLVQKSRCRSLPKKFQSPDVMANWEAAKPSPCK